LPSERRDQRRVDDLLDALEQGPDDWAARGLAGLGRHLAETAADTLDMAQIRP
jgi:hypothetical protein